MGFLEKTRGWAKSSFRIEKTSISAVGDARFPMSWFIIIITTKQLESHDYV
ncbi:transcriptional coactivator/pterin dehydratase [Streptococcus iniae 9117]|nr:transcriptional coactivator/pterin dehydratase [Streptococcus iniae 9117]